MRIGEVVQLGQHRLMCGDAGNPVHVAALFDGANPDLVFTSPPYLQQRQYDRAIDCWDTMMQRVFSAMPWHEKTQVLVNLGIVYRKSEWMPYWDGWIEWMRSRHWMRFGLYIWDKKHGLPGTFGGRPSPGHEFIFHFSRVKSPIINKCVPCVDAHKSSASGQPGVRKKNGARTVPYSPVKKSTTPQSHKIPCTVFRADRESQNRSGHPAVFPTTLPRSIIEAYTAVRETVYDPFCGSGTSIIAAEQTGRIAYGMDISPAYCDIAVERICKAMEQPKQGALAL